MISPSPSSSSTPDPHSLTPIYTSTYVYSYALFSFVCKFSCTYKLGLTALGVYTNLFPLDVMLKSGSQVRLLANNNGH